MATHEDALAWADNTMLARLLDRAMASDDAEEPSEETSLLADEVIEAT